MNAPVPRPQAACQAPRTAILFAEHSLFVSRSLRRLGVAPADVDDARQDVFMVVHRRVDEYEQLDVVRPWLFTISRLVANNYRRGVRRRDALHRLFVTTLAPPDAEEPGARQEAEQFLRRFLDTLSESQRLVFYLADIEGLTAPQIAASLGSNPNTVSSRIRKARQQFAAVLAAYRANRWRWRPRRWLRELASAELLE